MRSRKEKVSRPARDAEMMRPSLFCVDLDFLQKLSQVDFKAARGGGIACLHALVAWRAHIIRREWEALLNPHSR
jgi:hypothetical protein